MFKLFKKKQTSVEIINKWYNVITDNINFFTNYYNENQDKSYFKDNRHDQSIQSVIKKLYNCPVISANEIEFKHNQLPFHASRIKE